ncbi:MAG: class I SAM-dependent methyltransferase [Pseudomonadota bacterium]
MTLLWKAARDQADAARYEIRKFLEAAAKEIPDGALVLDAGAGNCRYRNLFEGKRYIGTDFCKVPGKGYAGAELITDLCAISIRNNSIDVIINIQVLEHVPEPAAMLKEFFRILAPGGMLYLTCPQGWGCMINHMIIIALPIMH